METLICKMCGGNLVLKTGTNIGVCEYCGTPQTVPSIRDERSTTAFNRANFFRRQNNFGKAISAYERILDEDETNAEAHWGIVLSRFGIEYVEDPKTHERIPTCHRVQINSILADPDYLAAVENAPDTETRELYKKEAQCIAAIQKHILSISQNEPPYDVFICYKETDAEGKRTIDSTIAQDIYYELTNQGYKVFFSRITLEDRLGQEYEPYIFAALNSARVMIVIGTSAENFNSVWVKNEWSRYLDLLKKDRTRMIIPCYRNMDAYDIPDELSMLQSQDMSKIGFLQDLIRGIKKVIPKQQTQENKKAQSIQNINENIEILLKRAFLALENSEWKSARKFCEKVLNYDPQNAMAYLGNLMAEEECCKKEDLQFCSEPFDDIGAYKNIRKFGDESLKKELSNYLAIINKRDTYNTALSYMNNAQSKEDINKALRLFASIKGFHDADDCAAECSAWLKEIQEYEEKEKKKKKRNGIIVIVLLALAAVIAISVIVINSLIIPKQEYTEAVALMEAGEDWSAVEKYAASGACQKNDEIFAIWQEQNAIAISAGFGHTVGVKNDGTVIATGYNNSGQCDVSSWSDIISVAAGSDFTIGLKSDGTVVATGENNYGQCDIAEWTDIVAIAAGSTHTVGLKSDGTVVTAGDTDNRKCKVSGWRGVTKIWAGDECTIGIKSDNSIVATGRFRLNSLTNVNAKGEFDSESWTNIVDVSAEDRFALGIKSDGTMVYTGFWSYFSGDHPYDKFIDLVGIEICGDHRFGLKRDGTVVTSDSSDSVLYGVTDWENIVAISAGRNFIVGLKNDGSVVAVGENDDGQCNVETWDKIQVSKYSKREVS